MSKGNPVDDVEHWVDRINSQLEEASRRWGSSTNVWGPGDQQGAAVDVLDRGDEFDVVVDLPGYTQEDVTATLTDRTLFVDAERESIETDDDEVYLRMERTHESVSRRVRLPEPVDPDAVTATMNEGVLTVTIGKATVNEDGTEIDIE